MDRRLDHAGVAGAVEAERRRGDRLRGLVHAWRDQRRQCHDPGLHPERSPFPLRIGQGAAGELSGSLSGGTPGATVTVPAAGAVRGE